MSNIAKMDDNIKFTSVEVGTDLAKLTNVESKYSDAFNEYLSNNNELKKLLDKLPNYTKIDANGNEETIQVNFKTFEDQGKITKIQVNASELSKLTYEDADLIRNSYSTASGGQFLTYFDDRYIDDWNKSINSQIVLLTEKLSNSGSLTFQQKKELVAEAETTIKNQIENLKVQILPRAMIPEEEEAIREANSVLVGVSKIGQDLGLEATFEARVRDAFDFAIKQRNKARSMYNAFNLARIELKEDPSKGDIASLEKLYNQKLNEWGISNPMPPKNETYNMTLSVTMVDKWRSLGGSDLGPYDWGNLGMKYNFPFYNK